VSPSHSKDVKKSTKPKKASAIPASDLVTVQTPRAKDIDSATLAAQSERARKEKSEARRLLEARLRWLQSETEITQKAIVDDDLATARSPAWALTNLSAAEVTRHVLTRHPRGASSVTIIREVQAAKPGADPKAVHAELRHARKEGVRRSLRYFPPAVEAQDEELYVPDPSEEDAQ
jgi:hypothetical protein